MLDDPAEIHYRHFGRDMLHHREIVADEEIGQPEFAPQFRKQIEDLRLHGNVQRAGRLVAHHDARMQHERTRDGDALPLASGELTGYSFGHLAGNSYARQHLHDAIGLPGLRQIALGGQRQADNVANALARVERGERVLEHGLDQARSLASIHAGEAAPIHQSLARGWRQQAHDQTGKRRLAAAGFTHDTQHVARRKRERHPVHCAHRATRTPETAPLLELPKQVADFDRMGHVTASRLQFGGNRHR